MLSRVALLLFVLAALLATRRVTFPSETADHV